MRRVVVLVALALTLTHVAGATPTWTPPQVISTDGIALAPELAMNPSGGAVAVWDEETGPDCATSPASLTCIHTVETAYRMRSGDPWDTGHAIARPGVGARPTAAINGGGDAGLLWVHDVGTFRVVQATLRRGPNGDFPNPNDLSDYVYEVRSHHIALDGAGDAVAVWWQLGPDNTFEVLGEVRPARLGYWGSARPLSGPRVVAGPSLAVTPAGKALVIWIENGVVKTADGDISAGTWNEPVPLPGSVKAVDEPQVVVNAAGDAVAAWRGPNGVQAAFRAAGRGWESPTTLSTGGDSPPHVAIDASGDASVVWVDMSGFVEFGLRSRDSGTWSPIVHAASGAAQEAQVAAAANGDLVALWIDAISKTPYASVRPRAAGAWQPSAELSSSHSSNALLAIDDSGKAVALWNSPDDQGVDVQTADLAGDWTPTLTNDARPVIRGKASVGHVVRCTRGTWSGTVPIRYAYRWRRGSAAVQGATQSSYRIQRRDAGSLLACRVTATNPARTLAATSRPVRVARLG